LERNRREWVLGLVAAAALPAFAEEAPRIEIWHGRRQRFGHRGLPQRWINLLGSVSPAARIAQIEHSLNGGEFRGVSKGPDLHRLASPGDFNLEIDHANLRPGENEVVIRAADLDGIRAEERVIVEYTADVAWELPYRVDFSRVTNLQDVCQVVDGRWRFTPDGVRTAEPYYDRVLAFGDMSWTNFAVTAEVIFHDFPGPKRGGPDFGVNHAGITLRWRGHQDDGRQPRVKWYPLGAATEFTLQKDLTQCRWRILPGPPKRNVNAEETYPIELGRRYFIKGQVETLPDGRHRYRNKIWSPDRNELDFWAVESIEDPADDFASGSALLIAHRADVTFCSVRIERV
jgi:hypothetical protein